MTAGTISRGSSQRSTGQKVALGIGLILLAALVAWVLFFARGTPADPLISGATDFSRAFLDALTIAGLYFIVAAGFTLIFGLMRVVNLAHGSLFLLGGYVALEFQKYLVGKGNFSSAEVSPGDWLLPLAMAAVVAGLIGLIIQQVFLRWFQGQDMRETLITIAISVILADQMVAIFGGLAKDIKWPGFIDGFIEIGSFRYSQTRLFMLFIAIVVGVALWAWLQKTRTGMVIRAGVDDTSMVQALGINVQVVFALAFLVGSALAGIGGVIGGSFAALGSGVDGNWLLNSIIVVIVGGMGSLMGAAAGSLMLGVVTAFAPAYLPANFTHYSVIFTFVLLAAVLAWRPYGLFGRPE
ncbi:MAG: branched-chain amino acid ABC transporter permease [Acidimicrobiia bacterium]